MQMRRVAAVLVVTALAVGSAHAIDRTVRGRQIQVKNPLASNPTLRKLVGQAKESLSNESIVGNPTVAGATLTVFTEGASSANQAFVLPASGWGPVSTGYKYKDSIGANGPVRTAQIQRSNNGTFVIKAKASARY